MQIYISKTLPKIEKAVSDAFPKKINQTWIEQNIAELNFDFNSHVWEEVLSKPFYELFERGGKRLRPLLACLAYESFGGKNNLIYQFSTIPEVLHTGTLMIDDIEDSSSLRRGKPTIHQIFSQDLTINCGNFLYFLPNLIVKNAEIPMEQKLKIYETINTEMTKLHLGQGLDILWSNQKNYKVSVQEYLQMSEYKTGTLLNLSLQIGGILANQESKILDKLQQFAYKIGVAFQIQDDILNLQNQKKWGKAFGEDIVEGKLTYLIVLYHQRLVQDENELVGILKKAENSQVEIERAVEILEDCGVFEKAEEYCAELIFEAKQILENFQFEAKYQKIWNEVLDFVVKRER